VAAVFWQAAAGSRARAARNVAVSSGLLPAEVDVPEYERLLGIHASNLAALAAYQPQPSTASVLLFQAAAAPARSESLTSWRAVCPHLEVDVLDGDHYSIVTGSQTAVIARRVSAWIGGRTATVSSGEEYR
jgi:thioesterase domain-containing protein